MYNTSKAIHVQYECLDLNADLVPGNSTNTSGGLPTLLKLYYHVHHDYDPQKKLTCAVSTK